MKVKHVTHQCLDGGVCDILLRKLHSDDEVITEFVSHGKASGSLTPMFENGSWKIYDKIYITDLPARLIEGASFLPTIANEERVVYVDHHQESLMTSGFGGFVSGMGCSALIVWNEFIPEELRTKELTLLVSLCNDWDSGKRQYDASRYLYHLYYSMWGNKFVRRFAEGFDGFSKDEKETIRKKERTGQMQARAASETAETFDAVAYASAKGTPDMVNRALLDNGSEIACTNLFDGKYLCMMTDREDINLGSVASEFGGGGHRCTAVIEGIDKDDIRHVIERLNEAIAVSK